MHLALLGALAILGVVAHGCWKRGNARTLKASPDRPFAPTRVWPYVGGLAESTAGLILGFFVIYHGFGLAGEIAVTGATHLIDHIGFTSR